MLYTKCIHHLYLTYNTTISTALSYISFFRSVAVSHPSLLLEGVLACLEGLEEIFMPLQDVFNLMQGLI